MESTRGANESDERIGTTTAWVEGRAVPVEEARVPLLDRGFMFGEAVYEALYTRNGRCFARKLHMERLLRSARGAGIAAEGVVAELEAGIDALLARVVAKDGLLYMQITGGVAPREHLPPRPPPKPGVYLFWAPINLEHLRRMQSQGFAVVTVSDQRWDQATFKTTQLLANILSKKTAREAGAAEALFLDARENLVEGGSTNVFVVKDCRVLTPPSDGNLLPGITRRVLLAGRPDLVSEAEVSLMELLSADECFVVSTSRPVVGVCRIDDRTLPGPVPGPLTRELMEFLAREMEGEIGN